MRSSKVLYMLAAVLCLLGAAAHEFVGAPMVLGPLEGFGLASDIIWLHHFSWHVGTVAVMGMVALFGFAVVHPAGRLLAAIASSMSAGFAALGITLAVFGDPVVWTTPAPYPWTLVAILGFLGIALSRRARA